jgi:hypothetical protein
MTMGDVPRFDPKPLIETVFAFTERGVSAFERTQNRKMFDGKLHSRGRISKSDSDPSFSGPQKGHTRSGV